MPQHPIVHIEFAAKDPVAAGKFYNQLFGWPTQDVPDFNYVTFSAPPGPGGGFPVIDGQTIKSGDVIVYVGTDDIDATLRRAEALGARTLLPKTEIPGIGWYAFFTDPSGNRVALYTGGPNGAGGAT